MKFLIIDDDFDSCQLLKVRLRDMGDSDTVTDGNKAFDLYVQACRSKSPYDIIFLDIVMPNIDGHQILVKIRDWEDKNLEPEQKVKIVMVSTEKDTKNIFSSLKEGCDNYMSKPIRKTAIADVMKKLGYATENIT